jgi:hypothetical protein
MQVARLTPADAESDDWFGSSLAIDGDKIVIGAHNKKSPDNAPHAGCAYVYKQNSDNSFTPIAQLFAEDTESFDQFGISVSISGDYIVVGAHYENTNDIIDAGSAYLFKFSDDTHIDQIAKLSAHDGMANAYFGATVAIDHNNIAIGASGQDMGYIDIGSAYVFSLEPADRPYIYNPPVATLHHDEEGMPRSVRNFIGASPAGDGLTWSTNGTDGGNFSMIGSSLSFDPKADFETPRDADSRNDYNLTVTARDARGHTTTIDVAIAVIDKHFLENDRFRAGDGDDGDRLGFAVAADGEYGVIGAPYQNNTGGAYLIKHSGSTTTVIAQLTASDAQTGDWFGHAVAIDGDYILIGANGEDTGGNNSGSAYLFKRNSDSSVTQIAKLTANDALTGDQFGYSVAISGNYLLVGAGFKHTQEGCAYLFKRNSDISVTQIAKLKASNAGTGDRFGATVAIDGNYLAIGAQYEDGGASNSGSVYLFKRNSDTSITQIAQLKADNPGGDDQFGASVSISGDLIVVGAPKDDLSGKYDTGSVYLFKRNSDTDIAQLARLNATDAHRGDNFGTSVSISGDTLVVGAEFTDSKLGMYSGNAYVFKHYSDTNITQIDKLSAGDAQTNDHFGHSVAISDKRIIIGAPDEDTKGGKAGSVYLFDKEE